MKSPETFHLLSSIHTLALIIAWEISDSKPSIVSDALPKKQFTTGMGYYACAQVVSQTIGPSIGELLKTWFGFEMTYILVGLTMFGCILLLSFAIKLAPRKMEPFKLTIRNMIAKEALIPASITFLIAMGFTSINSFLLVYAEERGIVGASLFFTVYALCMLVTRPMVGKLTDKYGFVKVSIPAVLATSCSLVLIGLSSNLFTLF